MFIEIVLGVVAVIALSLAIFAFLCQRVGREIKEAEMRADENASNYLREI